MDATSSANPAHPADPTHRTVRAVAVAAVAALVFGAVWGLLPAWSFWFVIACAFIITEGIVRVTGARRGSVYQTVGMLGVLACAVICRVVLAYRFGLSPGDIGGVLANARLDGPAGRTIYTVLALDIPNVVYAGLAMAIPYVRFR